MDTALPPTKRPFWQRSALAVLRTTVTLGVFAIAIGAGVAGYQALSAQAARVEGPEPAPATTVAFEVIAMQDSVTLPRRFTGQFEAPRDVLLGFEEGCTLAEVLVGGGDAVEEGAVIARLDTRLLEAERAKFAATREAVLAQVELARRTNDRQVVLFDQGHISEQRVDESTQTLRQLNATLVEIEASIAITDVRIAKAEITAPFTGRIGARFLDEGAIAAPGAAVVSVLEGGPARYRVALDPGLAQRLAPGLEVQIDVAGQTLDATLTELSPELDAATRSQIAFFDLADGSLAPPARATGDVILPDTQTVRGAWVPLSALRQGPRGAWTLMTVSADGVIGLEAAEILHLDEGRAFIRGTFQDGTQYLPGGTHRVVPGEAGLLAEAK